MIVVNSSSLSFAVNHKKWSNLFKSLVDCQKFGKPPNYDLLKKNGDRKGIIYMTCYISTCTVFAIIEAVEEQSCLKVSNSNLTSTDLRYIFCTEHVQARNLRFYHTSLVACQLPSKYVP